MVNLAFVRVKQSMMNSHKVAQQYSSFFPRRAATEQDTSTKPQDHNSRQLYKLIASWVPSVWDETVSSLCRWQIWGFVIYTYSCIRLFFHTLWTKRRKKNSWERCCIHSHRSSQRFAWNEILLSVGDKQGCLHVSEWNICVAGGAVLT